MNEIELLHIFHREDYKQFLQQPSGNLDDTGYFSVQVISKALSLWTLDLIPLKSTDTIATQIRVNPTLAQAYIFNMENHWFCIRRFKCDTKHSSSQSSSEQNAFFNLDSLLSRPEYMSSTYLTEYLKQMQNEGYSIFVVSGEFPECSAEPLPYKIDVPPTTFIDLTKSDSKASISESDDVQRAIQLSLADWSLRNRNVESKYDGKTHSNCENDESESADLEAAMKLSLECFSSDKGPELNTNSLQTTSSSEQLTPSRLRDKRLAYFSGMTSDQK